MYEVPPCLPEAHLPNYPVPGADSLIRATPMAAITPMHFYPKVHGSTNHLPSTPWNYSQPQGLPECNVTTWGSPSTNEDVTVNGGASPEEVVFLDIDGFPPADGSGGESFPGSL